MSETLSIFHPKIETSRALLLYSSDSPPSDNLISIQVDPITLNKIIADSEVFGKVTKKINFLDVNGLEKLARGESSKFSFSEEISKSVCDASCNVRCVVPKPTTTPPRPFIAKKDSATGPTYLPPIRRDEIITERTTARTFPTLITRPLVTTTTRQTPLRTTTQPNFTKTTAKATTRTTTRPPLVRTTPVTIQTTKTTARTFTSTTRTQTRPSISVTRPRSTPGPTYLPLAKKTTVRRSTITEKSYPPATWPSTTRSYTQTFPTWSAPIRRSTAKKLITTTPKYSYRAPSNSLVYAGEHE